MTILKLHHVPVLKKEILAMMFFEKAKSVFDGTLGLGGHAEGILETYPNIKKYIACDLDAQHLDFAKKRLQKWEKKTEFHKTNFQNIKNIIKKENPERPLTILLDLGLCSNHIDDAQKGFSFEQNGPLKMAFDSKENGKKCKEILNKYSKKELTKILKEFGEEPSAKKIANAIEAARKEKEITETFDLKKIIEKNTPMQTRKKSLMRVFQAIRIAVNEELDVLARTLEDAFEIMMPGDCLGIISYHGGEDKIVKRKFNEWTKAKTKESEFSLHEIIAPAKAILKTKKPITPSAEEMEQNTRSRSAKLRILQKTA